MGLKLVEISGPYGSELGFNGTGPINEFTTNELV